MFTKQALQNIEATGNVWGVTPEYRFRFTVKLPLNYKAKFEWRRRKSLMGRFGGGWNWKLGVQVGSTAVIFNCLTFMISISKALTAVGTLIEKQSKVFALLVKHSGIKSSEEVKSEAK